MFEKKSSFPLTLGALGVVFGDIGTSPLYSVREILGDLPINLLDILGSLSLIFWSLIIIISIKYLMLVFQADNHGEGGILALLALLKQKKNKRESSFFILATFGAGLIIGDGMLTPAISITSAIEGLETISASFKQLTVPLSCLILVFLFLYQSKGTASIGKAFGPVLLLWFIVIAILGVAQIIKNPVVLKAIHPFYAFHFLYIHGLKGYFLLGGVFLVVTGGEALYADIGHFGKNPIRMSWFFVALPGLLFNYFGQAANLLQHPEAISNPFYALSPGWFLIPLLLLSAAATVIASQAVISATFSMTKQAVLLGLYPRLPIVPTSPEHAGQIYVPQVNFFLLLGSLIIIFTFRNSSSMTHAYGIAVNLNMLLVNIMVAYAARKVWGWSLARIIVVFTLFFVVDLAFLGANSHKFLTGGWLPVLFAMVVATFMLTWSSGMRYLVKSFYLQKKDIARIIKQLRYRAINQLPNVTGIFITDPYDQSGGSFLHFLKLSLAVPENILIVNYQVENIPYVAEKRRVKAVQLAPKIYRMTLHYGFMDTVSIPRALEYVNKNELLSFKINIHGATYLVEIPNIVAIKEKRTLRFHWQEKLFAFMMRNYSANLNIEFYKLPYNRTIAIGSYCIL